MKIVTKTGNLMHVKEGHIVHGCNAQGVMGSGVALAVKDTYPLAYSEYASWISAAPAERRLGQSLPVAVSNELIVWNAVTQNLFGSSARFTNYEAVATCFEEVNNFMKQGSYDDVPQEVHIPLIGAARGGGNWEIIREIIEQTMEFPVTLWLPDSTVTTL